MESPAETYRWFGREHKKSHFGRFASALTLDTGGRLALRDFQRWALAPYFAGAVESLISTPKGQGKSTLLGALGLYEMLTAPESDVVVAAASRDQADRKSTRLNSTHL